MKLRLLLICGVAALATPALYNAFKTNPVATASGLLPVIVILIAGYVYLKRIGTTQPVKMRSE